MRSLNKTGIKMKPVFEQIHSQLRDKTYYEIWLVVNNRINEKLQNKLQSGDNIITMQVNDIKRALK